MKSFLICLLACIASFTLTAQDKKVVYCEYLDSLSKRVYAIDSAVSFRLYDSVEGTKFHMVQWQMKPRVMMAECDVQLLPSGSGVMDGRYVSYDDSGLQRQVGVYKNGKRDGVWVYFYEGTEDMWHTVSYKDNILNGVQSWYNKSNQLERQVEYKNGLRVANRCYDSFQNVMQCPVSPVTLDTSKASAHSKEVGVKPHPPYDFGYFVATNIYYPNEAKENDIMGRVDVHFVVNEDGSITDICVDYRLGGGCDEEAIRLISLMSPWVPGTLNGKVVPMQFIQPISYYLE